MGPILINVDSMDPLREAQGRPCSVSALAKRGGCPWVVFTFSFLISRQPRNPSWTHSKSKRLISFAISTEEVPG